jgi:hypothetical protein
MTEEMGATYAVTETAHEARERGEYRAAVRFAHRRRRISPEMLPYIYPRVTPRGFTRRTGVYGIGLSEYYPTPKTRIGTLSFEDAGRAIRILLRDLGVRPRNYIWDASRWDLNRYRRLDHRVVLWDARAEPSKSRAQKAAAALVAAGISDFRITSGGWLYIRIPKDAFVSSFYTSDDPQVWLRRNERRTAARAKSKAVREVLAKLDCYAMQ